jgi:hypothetical protein
MKLNQIFLIGLLLISSVFAALRFERIATGVTTGAAFPTVILPERLAAFPSPPLVVTVNWNVPVSVGVPLMDNVF